MAYKKTAKKVTAPKQLEKSQLESLIWLKHCEVSRPSSETKQLWRLLKVVRLTSTLFQQFHRSWWSTRYRGMPRDVLSKYLDLSLLARLPRASRHCWSTKDRRYLCIHRCWTCAWPWVCTQYWCKAWRTFDLTADNGEQALEIVESLVRSGKIAVVVIDSVAALTPKDEIEGEMAHTSWKASGLMSQALRKLTAIVAKSNTVVIFINQIRMQIGVMFGNPETTPGGKALKFYTSVRLDIRRIAQIKKGEEVVGGRHRLRLWRIKWLPHSVQLNLTLFTEKVSLLKERYLLLVRNTNSLKNQDLHTAILPWRWWVGNSEARARYDAARTMLKEDKKLAGEILKLIKKAMKEEWNEETPEGLILNFVPSFFLPKRNSWNTQSNAQLI